jgi:transposase-like protein
MREEPDMKIGGDGITVEIDETLIGGAKRFVGSGSAKNGKTLVIGMAERGGRIHLQVIPNRTYKAIKPVVDFKIEPDTSRFVTDGLSTYEFVLPRDRHEAGNHQEELKYKTWTTTQTVENAFSLFKRGIVGQYHQLSPWHLTRYMREFCWRYNRRGLQPWIFGMALNNMVCRKPLPYKELVKF